jgi:hypothetical protein
MRALPAPKPSTDNSDGQCAFGGRRSRALYVCPLKNGEWSVFGSDIAAALDTFALRDEAVEYACDLAEHLTPAPGGNGSIQACEPAVD